MKKFQKILLIIFTQIVLFTFLNVNQDQIVALLFPPLFSVTLFFSLLFLFDEKITKTEIWFGLFLAAIAIMSTGVGAHLTANAIHNLFDQELPKMEEALNNALNFSETTLTLNFSETTIPGVLYNYDEWMSHAIMFIGIILLGVSIYLLSKDSFKGITNFFQEFSKRIRGKGLEIPKNVTLKDYVFVSFIGSFLGVLFALMGIEGNMVYYGALLTLLGLSFIGVKLKQGLKMHIIDLRAIFFITAIASYLATTTAYFFVTGVGALTSFSF
ncbi:MAG: hypothetical protein GOU97_00480 [Nanoarchaeota archaeon]|nr:hypothetical protein [Nanoarchaeota archaeon]